MIRTVSCRWTALLVLGFALVSAGHGSQPGAAEPVGAASTARALAPVASRSVVPDRNADPAGDVPANAATAPTPYSAVPHRSATLDQLPTRETVAPVGIRIDDAGIKGPVVAVGAVPGSGELAVPPSADTVAWYEHGPSPGEPGSAVLAAHVDWHGQRGAFFTLATVPVGATAVVTLADGRDVEFTVTSREQVGKAELPVDRIFARDGPSQLVLVTCGGSFDRRARHYADNIIVFAVPAAR